MERSALGVNGSFPCPFSEIQFCKAARTLKNLLQYGKNLIVKELNCTNQCQYPLYSQLSVTVGTRAGNLSTWAKLGKFVVDIKVECVLWIKLIESNLRSFIDKRISMKILRVDIYWDSVVFYRLGSSPEHSPQRSVVEAKNKRHRLLPRRLLLDQIHPQGEVLDFSRW